MKTEDFLEMLNDIDESYIYDAGEALEDYHKAAAQYAAVSNSRKKLQKSTTAAVCAAAKKEDEVVLKPKYFKEDSSSKFPLKKVILAVAAVACVAAVGVFIWVKSNTLPVSPNDSADASSVDITSGGNSETSVTSDESAVPPPSDIPLQKISELRGELEEQVNSVKAVEYKNLNLTDDFVVKVPDTDTLYDLTLTKPAHDFKTAYEFFDKTFDKEFGDIYSQEDKERLYHVAVFGNELGEFNSDATLLSKHIDKLMSGEYAHYDIYVYTDKAYLTVKWLSTGIHGLNHDGIIKRAKDEERKVAAMSFGTDFFDVVKNYLDLDSEDRFEILDGELSVKEAAEAAKKIVSENKYGWGGALTPDVYQVKVLDIGEGKYGFSFTMTPSYKGVMFDAYEFPTDGSMSTRGEDALAHDYKLLMPRAFMMENGKFDSFSGVASEYSVTEKAAYDSVISFKDAVQMLSEKFGAGMDLSLSRAELIYTGMYPVNEEDDSVMAAFPVWKFRCHNQTDDLKYIIYINAINGDAEYYTTDWWDV